uniref:Aminotransferase class V domain-containing protein n=1 Tax=Hucho hucho TaxID=62062 RepID=A0A4W5MEA8_9TELE
MDFQTTTPMDSRVLDAMLPYKVNYYGNPHSRIHANGWQSALEKQVADLIAADPRTESVFVSTHNAKKKHIITTQTEHKCTNGQVDQQAKQSEMVGVNLVSNQILFVTCAEYNRCRPYSEMLTYKPLNNNALTLFSRP